MAYTVQQSISYAQTYCNYLPLAVGTGNEPALSIANEIQNMVLNAPFTWGWNRNENSATSTSAGTQDYTLSLTDFSFLEKVTLTDPTGIVHQVQDVYNTAALGLGDVTTAQQALPNAASVQLVTFGTSVKLRFLPVPDQIYIINVTYQKLVTPLSALTGSTGTWYIPVQYLDIYNNLFLGEALSVADDARANIYRQRGVTALLAKSEGLTEMQKNEFLEQYWARDRQYAAGMARTQQAGAARGV
jgi:hypothetical protein